jgi:hypothetical protein
VVSVPAPIDSVIAEAVVEAPPVTTVIVPKPGVDPTAAVLVTATLPTVTEAHAVPQVMDDVPEAAPETLFAK